MIKLKIKVTKDVLERSKFCGTSFFKGSTVANCAIAVAVRDIFPKTTVIGSWMEVPCNEISSIVQLPKEAQDFIKLFDKLSYAPDERVKLPELEFEVELPDEVVETIDIQEITTLLENHPSLELINL